MYGKHFASMYEGSLFGQPPIVFAVLAYAFSNARPARDDGECYVEINPILLAATFSTPADEIMETLRYLESPDPNSRSTREEGRRLVLVGDDICSGPRQYRLVNGRKYREMKDEDDRREQNRNAKRRQRAKDSGKASLRRVRQHQPKSAQVSRCQPKSAQEEVEVEAEGEEDAIDFKRRERGGVPAAAKRAREAKAKRIADWLEKNRALRCLACAHEPHDPRRCTECDDCDTSETALKDGLGGAFEAKFQMPWNAWTEQRAELETM